MQYQLNLEQNTFNSSKYLILQIMCGFIFIFQQFLSAFYYLHYVSIVLMTDIHIFFLVGRHICKLVPSQMWCCIKQGQAQARRKTNKNDKMLQWHLFVLHLNMCYLGSYAGEIKLVALSLMFLVECGISLKIFFPLIN